MTQTPNSFIMSPTIDYCFKELMQNPIVRQGFISALLKISPEEISESILLPTILSGDFPSDKTGILDVRVLLQSGTQLDLEMQIAYFEHWEKRILFYLSKIYTSQLQKGEDYDKLQKCIHVSILNFIHFPDDEECYRTIQLRDAKTGALYSDLLELQILELQKLPETLQPDNDIVNWMKFFNSKKRKEFETMAKQNEYIEEAYQTLLKISADDQKRLEYEAREKAIMDYNSQINSAQKRGERFGEERGIKIGEERGIQIGIERGLKIGEERGLKIGEERGLKIGEERGLKIGEERGLKTGEERGLKIARQIFMMHREGKSVEEIAAHFTLSPQEVKEILAL